MVGRDMYWFFLLPRALADREGKPGAPTLCGKLAKPVRPVRNWINVQLCSFARFDVGGPYG